MSELAIGTEFAGHRIEGVAGRGGMGIVYRALDLRLKRQVAMKVIAPELAQDAEFRERFERESQLAASIDHTNVIPIHGAGEDDGVLFITMRYVQGTDLAARIARDGRLEAERAVDIIFGVAGALDAAHERGLIHRDVKPANILIEQHEGHEHVYLTDFGLTKQTGSSGPTRTGFAVGTFDYMAPEQFLAQPIDARADVYALGCVLFEAVTGRVPFPRPGDAARMYAHIQESPPAPSEMAPNLPPSFDDVVAKALSKDPADRFQSAGELAEAAYGSVGIKPPSQARGPISTPAAPTVSTPVPAPPPAGPTVAPGAGDPTVVEPSPTPASPPPASPPPFTPPPPAAHGRRPVALLVGGAIAVAGLVALGLIVLGGGGTDVDTATPEGTVTGFLELVSEDDGTGACELLAPGAQAQAAAAPGDDCAAGLMGLMAGDDESERAAIKNASYSVDTDDAAGTAYVDIPDPQVALGSGTRQVTLGLEGSGGEWLISDIDSLCVANNVTC